MNITNPVINPVLRRPVECAQYCSQAFHDALKGYEMKSSMSRKGDC